MKSPLFFEQCNLYELAQTETSAHGGRGLIRFARVLSGNEVAGACNFIDFTTMPPGSTIGVHTHCDANEEYYLILTGKGTMVLGERRFPVKSGDLIRNPPGSTHALINDSDNDLQLFVFELRVPK